MEFPFVDELELRGVPELIVCLARFELSGGVAVLASKHRREGRKEGGREG